MVDCLLPSAGPTFDTAKSRQKPSAQTPLRLAYGTAQIGFVDALEVVVC